MSKSQSKNENPQESDSAKVDPAPDKTLVSTVHDPKLGLLYDKWALPDGSTLTTTRRDEDFHIPLIEDIQEPNSKSLAFCHRELYQVRVLGNRVEVTNPLGRKISLPGDIPCGNLEETLKTRDRWFWGVQEERRKREAWYERWDSIWQCTNGPVELEGLTRGILGNATMGVLKPPMSQERALEEWEVVEAPELDEDMTDDEFQVCLSIRTLNSHGKCIVRWSDGSTIILPNRPHATHHSEILDGYCDARYDLERRFARAAGTDQVLAKYPW